MHRKGRAGSVLGSSRFVIRRTGGRILVGADGKGQSYLSYVGSMGRGLSVQLIRKIRPSRVPMGKG